MRRIFTAVVIIVVIFVAGGMRSEELRLRRYSNDLLRASKAARAEALIAARAGKLVVSGTDSRRREFSLQALGGSGIPVYYITENSIASTTTRTTDVRADIGGGSGFTIGIWDAGRVGTIHKELLPRALWADPVNPDLSNHATHVAGTLIGSGSIHPGAKGMASEASLVCYANDDDIAEMAAEAAGGMLISNHSYGHIQGWYYGDLHDDGVTDWNWYWYGNTFISTTEDYRFGSYSDISEQVDSIACDAEYYLIVCSAGNHHGETIPVQGDSHYVWNQVYDYWQWSTAVRDIDGGLDGYDCLGDGWKTAKNSLTIGAVDDLTEYTGPADVELLDDSSWGPTDDGRIKPDLVGNGYRLYSTIGINAGHDSYTGTSQASANIAGSLALLQDWYMDNYPGAQMRAATLKALAICTAREAGAYPGPDYRFGYGLLDTKAAYDLLVSDNGTGMERVRELTIAEGVPQLFHYRTTASQPRVTICWNDMPGTSTGPMLNPPGLQLVNDIELMLERGGSFYRPWTLDPSNPDQWAIAGTNSRDNVERADIVNADVGDRYAIWIWNNGALTGGNQDVSLVVSDMQQITTWYVAADGSADFATIQGALNIASDGDTIVVYGGTYNESGLVIDKQLVISAPNGPELTIVDACGMGRCFFIESSAGALKLEGFTLANGSAGGSGTYGYGGCVYCASATARIIGCIVTGGSAAIRGGGIYFTGGTPEVDDCLIEYSSAPNGGGIYAYYSTLSITGSEIAGCFATGYGGGIYCYHSDAELDYCLLRADSAGTSGGCLGLYESIPLLLNCTLNGGHGASHGGGIYAGTNSYPVVTNTIVAFSSSGEGIYGAIGFSGATVSCSDVYGNAGGNYGGSISNQTGLNGNISSDPLFCDVAAENFGLQGISPCMPGNNTCGVQIGFRGQNCHSKSFWYVNTSGTGDAPTIQAAIDSTFDGDTVMVAAGTYTGEGNRDIEFRGKGILVISESGRDLTIVDCESAPDDNHAGFLFITGEDSTAILDGFTVTRASLYGARSWNASPVIRNCNFVDNDKVQYNALGGGLRFEGGEPEVVGCNIADNGGADGNGGVRVKNARLLMEDCEITGNTGGSYGGMRFESRAGYRSVIRGCVISSNFSGMSGGAIRVPYDDILTVENCQIIENSAQFFGGAIVTGGEFTMTNTIVARNSVTTWDGSSWCGGILLGDAATITGSTIVSNSGPNFGSGIYLGPASPDQPVVIENTIVAFNHGSNGIFLDDPPAGSDVSVICCDVYGNDGEDYGGDIADQTGVNGNISENPLFCDTLSGDYYIYDDSPCAPEHSECETLVGLYGVACFEAPNLIAVEFSASDLHPEVGDAITFTVKVKNDGVGVADSFLIGFYRDRTTAPVPGFTATLDTLVTWLAAGDSVTWMVGPLTSDQFCEWSAWLLADSDGRIRERDEDDNTAGPVNVTWGVPEEDGWPVAGSLSFHGAPALANIDNDPRTLETIIGDDNGYLHIFEADGTCPKGWPIDLQDSLIAAPAVGNIEGDWRPEIVVGSVDGYLHSVNRDGSINWSVDTEKRIGNAVSLADLDGDGYLDIVLTQYGGGTGSSVRIFDGTGIEWEGNWPLKIAGLGISEPAVGDVDDDGDIEISFVTWGYTSPSIHSRVHLVHENGVDFSTGWPVTIDTVIIAPPVMGDIISGSAGLEIVVGGLSGEVFVIDLNGTIWPSIPKVEGMIETSPILVEADKDSQQEIMVTSRFWWSVMPPFGNWKSRVTLIDGDGSVVPGWPNPLSSPNDNLGPVPSPISIAGSVLGAGPLSVVYSWWLPDADDVESFPIFCGGHIRASMAAGDIDGDGYVELVAPALDGSLYCWQLSGSGYDLEKAGWPMYRHDAMRTGCWYIEPLTDTGRQDELPSVTRLDRVWPNPFNPAMTLRFSMSRRQHARIAVYDVSGRLVKILQDGVMDAGWHDARWDGFNERGHSVASGVYFCRMTTGSVDQSKKLILLR